MVVRAQMRCPVLAKDSVACLIVGDLFLCQQTPDSTSLYLVEVVTPFKSKSSPGIATVDFFVVARW